MWRRRDMPCAALHLKRTSLGSVSLLSRTGILSTHFTRFFCLHSRRSAFHSFADRLLFDSPLSLTRSLSNFYRDWLVTMLGVVGSIKTGPILEYPLIEKNLQRDIRPIVTKVRKVRGKRGWFLRRLGRFFVGPVTPEGLGHHAIQVGDYAYELHTDEANQKYLIVQRLTGEQIWMSTVKHEVVGYTDLSDEDIQLTCKFS